MCDELAFQKQPRGYASDTQDYFMNPKVSIIIRTKNEEKWIGSCLDAVFRQSFRDFEVVLVDNSSTDRTVEKAKKYPITLVELEEFLPGKAINDGVRASKGEILVILSGHCNQ
eukprot:TRINITY_DN30092_c0_g1_i1.p1 TRINITY_DN30092_c0_g1~~TRINITY_DN30092_c0_g1_i1.p1  ORF type:complete len:113 (+),score=6.45 TRINITY_DN30092_c0_g1_i1:90-428(+)